MEQPHTHALPNVEKLHSKSLGTRLSMENNNCLARCIIENHFKFHGSILRGI